MRVSQPVGVVMAAVLLVACRAEPPPPTIDDAVHFRTVIDGAPIHLALDDCEVFVQARDGSRQKVLDTDFYPMLTMCQIQRVSADASHITVELGRMALGAGGCCATGGTWRSRDGRVWERRIGGKWLPPGVDTPTGTTGAEAGNGP